MMCNRLNKNTEIFYIHSSEYPSVYRPLTQESPPLSGGLSCVVRRQRNSLWLACKLEAERLVEVTTGVIGDRGVLQIHDHGPEGAPETFSAGL